LEPTVAVADFPLPDTLAELAERIRQITVRVHGRSSGSGSGVIWRPDGHIVTNAHVARRFATVVLPDGRAFQAEVSGWDPARDVALIKVDAERLPAAAIGDSASLRPGDLVFASGHPFGGARALTAGVVHAVRKRGGSTGPHWVEADVRVEPGNSGGPLVDARGRVVGVTAMVADGLALAVPSDVVERFLGGAYPGGRLGVTVCPVVGPRRDPPNVGFVVLEVAPGSPAAEAGLVMGDVLIAVDEQVFRRPDDLLRAVETARRANGLRLEFTRGGARRTRTVLLGRGRHPATLP
jgi:serine protease Do